MIIIPMAGLSSRFFKAGYTKPKYMLELCGVSLFKHSVKSFEKYFKTLKFIFIIRGVHNTEQFVRKEIKELGIVDFEIVTINDETRGQAETIALGLERYRECPEPVTIFNIDTFRPGFKYPDLDKLGEGYLEVFTGSGDNWSFVRLFAESSSLVELTAEKKPISNLCCTGLYHFSLCSDYFEAYEHYLSLPRECWEKGELYVAPLYNYLIQNGKSIHCHMIDSKDVFFCGTPKEYEDFTTRDFLKISTGSK